jgi:hypothetical protein
VDYEALYKKLAQAVVKAEGKIGDDTAVFVARFVAQLRAQGYQLDGAADSSLTGYLADMETTLKSAITEAVVIGSGLALTAENIRSKAVMGMMTDAFAERWPDGLTLSDRLWRWTNAARDGVEKQLAQGVALNKANGSIVYDMQRAIERANAGQRFKIVSDSLDNWVEELHHNALSMIHSPDMKKEWQGIIDDVAAHIESLSRTGTRTAAEQLLKQIKKAVEAGDEALVDAAVKWWTYDKQLYDLKRIVRTEMATAAHRAVIASSVDDPTVIGYQWRLSGSHPVSDICDYYASIEMGLGKGVWTKEAVPKHKAHPHCMCLIIPRVTHIKQRGNRNYGEFIKNAPADRRAQLLPAWANDAVKGGAKLDSLIRPDGLGILTHNEAVAAGLVAKQ